MGVNQGLANAEERGRGTPLPTVFRWDVCGVAGGQGDMTRTIVIIVLMLEDDERHGWG